MKDQLQFTYEKKICCNLKQIELHSATDHSARVNLNIAASNDFIFKIFHHSTQPP